MRSFFKAIILCAVMHIKVSTPIFSLKSINTGFKNREENFSHFEPKNKSTFFAFPQL